MTSFSRNESIQLFGDVDRSVVPIVLVRARANTHFLTRRRRGADNMNRLTGYGRSLVLTLQIASVPILQPQGAAYIVTTAIGIDPSLHAEVFRLRQFIRRNGIRGRIQGDGADRSQAAIRGCTDPIIEKRKEAVQELACGIAHGEKADGDFRRVSARPAVSEPYKVRVTLFPQETQQVPRDKRAQAVRDDDYPGVALLGLGDVAQQRDIPFDDL